MLGQQVSGVDSPGHRGNVHAHILSGGDVTHFVTDVQHITASQGGLPENPPQAPLFHQQTWVAHDELEPGFGSVGP